MLPDLTFLWVIAGVLLLAVALDRVLFKPLLRVMREREAAVKSAMDLAETASAKAQAAGSEFDSKLAAARADLYRQMDERRKIAEGYRSEVMAATRTEVDATLSDARAKLQAQTVQVRARLDQDADQLGREIAEKILGRG